MLPTLLSHLFAAVAQGSRFLVTCLVNFQGRSLGFLNFLPMKNSKERATQSFRRKNLSLVFFL